MRHVASPAIKISSLSKSFGSKVALSDITLSVSRGAVFGFLGPNGAGKTTTIRCLMDFIRPDNGSVTILGKDAHTDSTELKRTIGFLSSDSQLNPHWTGQDHIALFESVKGRSPLRNKLITRLGLDTKTKVKALSSGNKQKLAIVLCFVGNPQLLIMDEPTRGLDPLLQNELYSILREFIDNDKAVFLSSHNLAEVERICDSVALIKDGVVAEEKAMADIRQMKAHIITAATGGTFDAKSLHAMPNVSLLTSTPHEVTLKVRGDINKPLKALLGQRLTDLSVSHVSLEDIFLDEYRQEQV